MKADIPRPLRIPRWVPKQVAAKARELSRTGKARFDGPLLVASEADFQRLLRLTTDPRMKWVWRELGKRRGDDYLYPAWQSKQPVADRQGIGMTILFLHALKLIKIMREVWSDRVSSASRKDAAYVRKKSVTMARTLRALAEVFVEPPSSPDELDRENARKLEAAAEVFDQLAVKPHVRDRGNTLIRYITGDLVKTCRVIFGSSMYGVVATITSVLLGDSNIPASTIRNWYPRK